MEGIIKNYRRGRRTQNTRQAIILLPGVDKKAKAYAFMGKKVEYKTECGKKICGKIVDAHGDKGAVRAIFEKGLPGQAIGSKVLIQG
ncbi:MAG: 50S ribosomal protein L35ae [Candidatus Diapherotrites archaeon]|nr:50S ribosomal protein L35ae [Candidatus Diapherotrites archaeon]